MPMRRARRCASRSPRLIRSATPAKVQGGFIAAMLDDTLGPTVLVKSGGAAYCATIDLNVQFLAPAMPGAFEGEGRLVQLGKSVAFLAGELHDAAGALVATATASARVVPTAGLTRI